eukprot:44981-Eustigmatos_ZCMA.PRE.1
MPAVQEPGHNRLEMAQGCEQGIDARRPAAATVHQYVSFGMLKLGSAPVLADVRQAPSAGGVSAGGVYVMPLNDRRAAIPQTSRVTQAPLVTCRR